MTFEFDPADMINEGEGWMRDAVIEILMIATRNSSAIRSHTGSDCHAIAQLRWRLKKDDMRGLNGRRNREFVGQYVRHLGETDRENRTVHWLVEEDGAVLCEMTVRIVQKELSPVRESESWGYLTNSFVVPEKQNLGLGTQLLEAIKSWTADLGLELLIVWPSEASYAFYRRAGFKGRDDPLELILNADEE